jgi:uncharacterized lipoprotein YddW (UPF0748 family)
MGYHSFYSLLVVYALAMSCSKKITQHSSVPPVAPKREFRAAWVATVDNIDWPSQKGLSADVQQEEFKKLMNGHQRLGINAVLVQVRAAADAFYAQSTEPWSEWLSGKQGRSPEPYYDPMLFMIQEAHNRDMEFHAWLNLSRGTHKSTTNLADNAITKQHPDWFFTYDKTQLFNFGKPEVRAYIVDVVRNIVRNYDVDGIHFDDYFYPYTVTGQRIDDEREFRTYGRNFRNIEDWRRNNIDELIREIGNVITQENPRVKFGISPFGVWRNASVDREGSATQAGQPSYDNLYADTRKWFREGWIDYIAPQVYFSFEFDKVPYQTLTEWWANQPTDRLLFIGHGTYRIDANGKDRSWADPTQIPRQLRFNRETKRVAGSIFYNTTSLQKNGLGVADSLRNFYAPPALQPRMPWKDDIAPNSPSSLETKRIKNVGIAVTWQQPALARDREPIYGYVVYRFDGNEIINLENPHRILTIIRNGGLTSFMDKTAQPKKKYYYVVTAIDRLHNESRPSDQILVK